MSLFDYLIELSMLFFLALAVLYCMRKVGYDIHRKRAQSHIEIGLFSFSLRSLDVSTFALNHLHLKT